jgi:magnesium transporter
MTTGEIPEERLSAEDLKRIWPILLADDRAEGFLLLEPSEAEAFFLGLATSDQARILERLPEGRRRLWMRLLAPDDAADVLQQVAAEQRPALLQLLDETARHEVSALLAYAEDSAGGLMSPRFARIRAEMSVDEAISYLRRQARNRLETIYYAYVLDAEQRLIGVVSFRELFAAPGHKPIAEVMRREVDSVPEDMHQEEVSRIVSGTGLMAVPVVDAAGRMKGIVTIDDVVQVVDEEATEDVQRFGGLEALEQPYLQTALPTLIRKRASWLAALFLGEMLTASAMGYYEDAIARAVVLALFVPLIISSGGNSGSQAATLVIRAMALGEVGLRDWWRIMRREVLTGLSLGLILAAIGLARIVLWEVLFDSYGEYYLLVALTVALSLVGVVLWGTLSGSMLPFLLRALGLDPASASAPFVATLVDVSGLVIYFTVASVVLGGTLL